jgi:hypothetical protein
MEIPSARVSPTSSLVTKNGRPFFRSSMLGSWRTCAHRMHLEYVERLPRARTSFAIAFGQAMHTTLAFWWFEYGNVDVEVTDARRNHVRRFFVDRLSLELHDATFDRYDVKEFGTETFAVEGLRKQGLRVLDLILSTVVPLFEPLAVEQPFVVSFGDRPFDLRGIPDLFADMRGACPCCGTRLGRGVVDYKFSLSPASYVDASHTEWVQGTCYTPAFVERFGTFPDFVALLKFKRVGRGGPSWQIFHSRRDQHDVDALWRELDCLWHDIEHDIHPATGLGSPLCSRQWCSYFDVCEPRLVEERRFLEALT